MLVQILVIFACVSTSLEFRFKLRDLADRNKNRCEKVRVDICRDNAHANYNSTIFPNEYNHETQEEAAQMLATFKPLIRVGCSDSLAAFLCSVYVPVCSPSLSRPLQPCRSLCEESRRGCEPLMSKYSFPWRFDCSKYPIDGTELCVGADFVKKQKMTNAKTIKMKKGWVLIKQHAAINIVCEPSQHIYIRKLKQKQSSCCPIATKSVLSAMCNGKQTCIIANTRPTLGGHCTDKIGDLWLRYKCISKNKAFNCKTHTA